MSKSSYFLLPLFILASSAILAQDDNSDQRKDFELWTRADLSWEFLKDFEMVSDVGYRLDEYLTRTKKIFGEISAGYKGIKWLRLKVKYRFTSRRGNFEHRLSGDALLRFDINRFRITLRNRLQREWLQDNDIEDFLRERLKISYNIRNFPVDPFISGEAWYHYNTEDNQYEEFWTDFGIDWKINKKNDLELCFRLSREINVKNPLHSNIISLKYSYAIN
ncbi:MAG: DUF2490 domain-containing protein [Bacteroidales bacterium]|nr:MAG: DUF2490 domain-containing protein [Bacteroidales bacterium]